MKSDCQVSFGCAASNLTYEERGRFRGSGTIRPASCRIRRIVDTDGARSPSCWRCQPSVTGPASNPAPANASLSCTIRSRTRSVVACGCDPGALDRGSNPSNPSAR